MSENANLPSSRVLEQLRMARTAMRTRIRYADTPADKDACRHWLRRIQQAIDSEQRELVAHDRMS